MRFPTRALTYAGVALIAIGFAAIGFVWGKVAALTSVPLQVPYLVSGGLTSLGLILVGVTLINVQAKLSDARRRDRQIEQLSELLDQIRVLLGGEEREPAAVADETAQAPDQDADDGPFERPGEGSDASGDTDEIPLINRPFARLARKS